MVERYTRAYGVLADTRPTASRGLSRPQASRAWITQHLPTGFACRCAALRVDKQGYPPHGLPPWFENSFPIPPGRHSRGEPPGVPERGGLQAPRGSGGVAPCRGSRRRRGTRWGLQCAPLWGADISRLSLFRARKNLAANASFFGFGLFGRLLMFAVFVPKCEQCQPNDEQAHYENLRKS